ncbi:amidohydrolase [Lutimonas sp.]|uniref:amidohydrolase n=1 Tax=Lutimonas sp. TaxID=1872403 RepID=UPI003C71F781
MAKSLTISLVQTDNVWENIDVNLKNLTSKIEEIQEKTDMIILPELFTTGFTMEAEGIAETMDGVGIQWMLDTANKKECVVLGSLLIIESGNYFNRLIVAFPDGNIKHYDKRHLFSFAGEDKVFKAGTERMTFEYKGFKICPLICYDLRFPVWARNTEDFDLIIFVANWPNARMLAWDTLLKARAIENLCYVIGLNRVGIDNNQLVYTGHSAVYDAMGATLLNFEPGEGAIGSVSIDIDHIEQTRSKFRFLEDRDSFVIN